MAQNKGNISEQVAGFSSSHQKRVVKEGEILLENGVTHVMMRAGANEIAVSKTPELKANKVETQIGA